MVISACSPGVVPVVTEITVNRPLCRRVGRRLPLLPSCSSKSTRAISTIGGGDARRVGMGMWGLDGRDLLFRHFGMVGLDPCSSSASAGEHGLGSSSSTIPGTVGGFASRFGGGDTFGSVSRTDCRPPRSQRVRCGPAGTMRRFGGGETCTASSASTTWQKQPFCVATDGTNAKGVMCVLQPPFRPRSYSETWSSNRSSGSRNAAHTNNGQYQTSKDRG